MDRLLKNVDERRWRDFKAEASRHGVRLGDFLGVLVDEHRKQAAGAQAWRYIMARKGRLSRDEAERLHEAVRVFDAAYGFEE